MKALFINVVGLAVLLALPGQAAPSGLAPGNGQEVAPGVSTPPTAPTPILTPEDQVAYLVRAALRAPDQDEARACLDLALSKMNAPAVEGQESSHQAMRVADSLACPSGSDGTQASSSSASTTPPGGLQRASGFSRLLNGAWQWVNRISGNWEELVVREPWIPPGLLLLASVGLLWLGRRSVSEGAGRPRQTCKSRTGAGFVRRGPLTSRDNPQALALALWEGGLPSPEIARRTGLAQDALSVLFSLKGKQNPVLASSPPHPSPPNPYASAGAGRR
jgi:hypothetical protein